MEEEENDQDTSIKGRLVALVNKIMGQPHKAKEKPTEKEQAMPCKNHLQLHFCFIMELFWCLFVFDMHKYVQNKCTVE